MFNAKLVIARLDQLSRDVHFLLGLEQAGVEFIAVDIVDLQKLINRQPHIQGTQRRPVVRLVAMKRAKKGRPRIEDRAKTIEARKPWLKLEMSFQRGGSCALPARTASAIALSGLPGGFTMRSA